MDGRGTISPVPRGAIVCNMFRCIVRFGGADLGRHRRGTLGRKH
jgi:hypothetical protein